MLLKYQLHDVRQRTRSSAIHIAFVVEQYPVLSQTFIVSQVAGLLDLGHDVDVFARLPGPDAAWPAFADRALLSKKLRLLSMPGRLAPRVRSGALLLLPGLARGHTSSLRALNALRYGREALSLRLLHDTSAFRGRDYDVVHAHFGPIGLRALRWREAGAFNAPLVTTFYGHDISAYVQANGASVYAPLFAGDGLCVGITDLMCRRLIEAGCPPERTLRIPLGLDLAAFCFRPSVRRRDEPLRVLSVGRLVEKKGFDTALRAIALLVHRHPDVRLQIVGGGPQRPQIEALIDALGLDDNVELLGALPQDRVIELMQSSHLFVLASQTAADGDQEGLPRVLAEAQAIGLPVVSTLHSGIPEGVLDGESAYLGPERDPEALAERLAYLIERPALWSAMGAAGRAFIEREYDASQTAGRLVAAYERLIS
jgi:colanic acid/amylovoran biosynthesis glycosyltransferase